MRTRVRRGFIGVFGGLGGIVFVAFAGPDCEPSVLPWYWMTPLLLGLALFWWGVFQFLKAVLESRPPA